MNVVSRCTVLFIQAASPSLTRSRGLARRNCVLELSVQ